MSVEDKKVPLWDVPVIDSQQFSRFVEEVYGQKFSGVQGIDRDMISGNGSLVYINLDEWVLENNECDDWGEEPVDVEAEFARWKSLEGWNAHNDSPAPEVLFLKLREDGYEVPNEFQYHVWW